MGLMPQCPTNLTNMAEEPINVEKQESVETEPVSAPDQDPVLELNFVPEWARKPPEQRFREFSDDERPSRDRQSGRGRPFDRNRERPGPGQDRGRPRRGGPTNRRDQGGESRGRRPPREFTPIARVSVHIIPERRQLASLVRQIHSSRKSYQVMQLASLLLSNPQFCLVKIEPDHTSSNTSLLQCKTCRMVVTDKATLVGHILKAHMDEYFEKTEVVAEPPAG
jgi:hypothetical protein